MVKHHPHRLPEWAKPHIRSLGAAHDLKVRLRQAGLHTVCESAKCPNIGECFQRPTATVMIMGDICTRNCSFCAILRDRPGALDPDEPRRLADMILEVGLRHVVMTSVARDDLSDEGAAHFAACVRELKSRDASIVVEILTPDFHARPELLDVVADAPYDIFNHNLETVRRLQRKVRPQADYDRSLAVLAGMAARRPDALVKSGIMVGLGETNDEVYATLADLHAHGVRALTIGQYLRPRESNQPVHRYVTPAEFDEFRDRARSHGFRFVASGPLVRSSYLADRQVDLSAVS